MKRIFLLNLALIVLLGSCRKPQEIPPLSATIVSGAWKVQTMRESTTNFTAQYNGWILLFTNDGNLSVTTPGGGAYSGTWRENADSRQITIVINGALIETARLSREWDIVLVNPSRIRLANDRFAPTQELVLDKL